MISSLSLPLSRPHLQVHRDRTVREGLEVNGKYLQGDVVVVQLVVAHRHVHVERKVVAVF